MKPRSKRRIMTWAYYLCAMLVLWIAARWINGRAQPAHMIGVQQGRLAECPDSPNCVSTQAADASKRVEPIQHDGPPDQTLADIETVVRGMSGGQVVNQQDKYLHAEFRSLVFGFVDDVEFYISKPAGQIEVRSASRVGYSDLGANRRRVEEIRRRLAAIKNP